MFLIDTNIHAAYLLQKYENDSLTKQYLDAYEQLSLTERVVSDFVVNEFELFMMQVVPSRYRLNQIQTSQLKQVVSEYLNEIFDRFTLITPTVVVLKRGYALYRQYADTHYISFTDSLFLATAEHYHYTIFTKDIRLIARAKELAIACYSL